MQYKKFTDLVGNTPIIELPIEAPCPILGKCEFMNPSGSIKDRPAAFMLQQAEASGQLRPGGTIIEASSGNQGIALSMLGALKGYRVIIVAPSRVSQEKILALKAYGAEVIICRDNDPEYTDIARELHEKTPNSFMPNQYYNVCNAEAHFRSTAPEIWEQTKGEVTHLVLAMGSCGTINGISRYIKARNPDVRIIGVDSDTSLRTLGHIAPYDSEGIGVDVLDGGLFEEDTVDDIITISDKESFQETRALAKQGLMMGIATGATVNVIRRIAHTFKPTDKVLTILTDSGRNYLQKVFQPRLVGEAISEVEI